MKSELRALANEERRLVSMRFFKTGKGEYGEGDTFIGVTVPNIRKVVKAHRELPLAESAKLLKSAVHEHRLAAAYLLVLQFERGDAKKREQIYRVCLDNLDRLNNWDLIDTAAPRIGGPFLNEHRRERKILDTQVKSEHLWTRRWAVMCTYAFIREGEFAPTLKLARRLLKDEHDLIHKAVGWMLREVGNRDRAVEREFLDQYARRMPRTMLRYAIEKFPERERKRYLAR